MTAPLVASSVVLPSGLTVPSGQTLTLLNGSSIDAAIVNDGTIVPSGNVAFNGALTTAAGSFLRLGAIPGTTTLTVANGFTNHGLIELTNNTAGYSSTLAVTAGTLVNAA